MLTTNRPNAPRLVSAAAIGILIAACSGATSSSLPTGSGDVVSPPPSAAASPSARATVGAIDHKTGATDVVLRLEQGGGFVPIDFLAAQAPTFTLYGDGVVIFQPRVESSPRPDASGVVHSVPWRTAKLDEGQIQELIEFALGPGGLGTARDAYMSGGIADAPNTIFTIRAGGLDKAVVVNALSEERAQGPDSAARAGFLKVAQRLGDFDRGGTIATDVYQPSQYRGVLSPRDTDPAIKPIAWPWPAIEPTDFKEGANDAGGGVVLPHRTLSSADVDALGIKEVVGGLQNVVLTGPDGKTYGLIVRPLLPDEAE
jgi:hypothetical protein